MRGGATLSPRCTATQVRPSPTVNPRVKEVFLPADRGQCGSRHARIRFNPLIIRNSLKHGPRKHVAGYLGRSRNNLNASTRSWPSPRTSPPPSHTSRAHTRELFVFFVSSPIRRLSMKHPRPPVSRSLVPLFLGSSSADRSSPSFSLIFLPPRFLLVSAPASLSQPRPINLPAAAPR